MVCVVEETGRVGVATVSSPEDFVYTTTGSYARSRAASVSEERALQQIENQLQRVRPRKVSPTPAETCASAACICGAVITPEAETPYKPLKIKMEILSATIVLRTASAL